MILAIFGPEKTAKSTLALTAPGKIGYLNLERGFSRVEPRFRPEGVLVESFALPLEIDLLGETVRRTGWRKAYKGIMTKYIEWLESKEIDSIAFDTFTIMWKIVCEAQLEKIQDEKPGRSRLQQIEYAEPNARMNAILDAGRRYEKNLILVHHETDEYKRGQDDKGNEVSVATGRKVLDGFRSTPNWVDMSIRTGLRKGKKDEGAFVPYVTVELCGLSLEMMAEPYNYMESPTVQKLLTKAMMLRGEAVHA